MAEPTRLDKFRKQKRKATARSRTLCGRGFHKWQFSDRKQFDVKSGRLVSIEKCARCGEERTHVQ